MDIYTCDNFRIEELVSPEVHKDRGWKAWQLLDRDALIFIDYLRDKFGPATVNNWVWGGDRLWSGLRTPDSPYYSLTSQHTSGRAYDLIFSENTSEDIREWLKENTAMWSGETGVGSITVEEGVKWLHIDFRNNCGGYNSFSVGG